MSEYLQTTSYDLWVEARKMTVSVAQVTGDPSTLRITWTLPPTPYVAYAGCVVLLAEVPILSDDVPEDGKRYTASSNWAAPADVIGRAQVVGAYYGYFGDDISVITLDVSNTDPTKVYYATIHAASNILQYYTIGVHSYPLESDRFHKSSDTYAGSIPESSTPPPNPTNGQVYYDPTTNTVLIWHEASSAWIESDTSTVDTGVREPILPFQLYVNRSTPSLRVFVSGMWVDCNAANTRVKYGTSWVPLGNVTIDATQPTTGNSGDVVIFPEPRTQAINDVTYTAKIFSLGQWLKISPNLIQFETAPSVWENVVFGDSLISATDPEIPDIGAFFYKTSTKDLLAWSGENWVKADTDSEGTPTFGKVGIGDDGSYDERLDLMRQLKTQLGWPSVCLELKEEAFNMAINNAMETFRQRADNAYHHRYVLFTIKPGQQTYYLNDPRMKTDRIVNILRIGRVSRLGTSQINDPVYGQLFIPKGLADGQVDIVSIHLMHQLAETFEKVFAGNLVHTWDEASRVLTIHRKINQPERIVLEVVMERTEQELLLDRWCQQWIQGWALAELKEALGMIRSKYGSIAGPNGGVTLNGDVLLSEARLDFEDLQRQLNDYEVGNGGTAFGNTSFFIM